MAGFPAIFYGIRSHIHNRYRILSRLKYAHFFRLYLELRQ
jgi:hypothetical protein